MNIKKITLIVKFGFLFGRNKDYNDIFLNRDAFVGCCAVIFKKGGAVERINDMGSETKGNFRLRSFFT